MQHEPPLDRAVASFRAWTCSAQCGGPLPEPRLVLGDKVRPRMVLTPEDLELLKQLKAAGECGRNIRGFNTRVALQRLARGGYVVARAGVELVNYRITKRGEDAIAEHD